MNAAYSFRAETARHQPFHPGGESFEANLRIIRRDGEIRYVNARGGAIRDERGQIIKLAGTTFDITQWVIHSQDRDPPTLFIREQS